MASMTATATLAAPLKRGQSASKQRSSESDTSQFFWTDQEEPHRSRRMQIIKAHPEVTKLCGIEPLTKWIVLAVVALQVACAFLLRDTPMLSPTFFSTAYIIGATANQNLFLAIHEISHNLAFKSPQANRLVAVFANLPIAIPYSAAFRVSSVKTCHVGLSLTPSIAIPPDPSQIPRS